MLNQHRHDCTKNKTENVPSHLCQILGVLCAPVQQEHGTGFLLWPAVKVNLPAFTLLVPPWCGPKDGLLKGESGYFQPKTHLEVASTNPIQQQCEGCNEKAPCARMWPLLPISQKVFTSAWEKLPNACSNRASLFTILYLPHISHTLKTAQV